MARVPDRAKGGNIPFASGGGACNREPMRGYRGSDARPKAVVPKRRASRNPEKMDDANWTTRKTLGKQSVAELVGVGSLCFFRLSVEVQFI